MRVEAIQKIKLPSNKVEVQSFLGKVNFLRIFIVSFAEIVKYVTDMLGKDKEIKWTFEAKQYFEDIKKAISKARVLASPNFSKYFLIFSFASEHTVVRVLLQKNQEGRKKPIAFYIKTLRDAPLKYNILDKQAYAQVQALKYF